MRAITELFNRLRSLLRRGELDREMAEQMRLHIELQAQANERAGMSPEEALRAARLSFGSMERFRAECRDARRFGVLEDATSDARFALRSLATERSFSIAAVLALAIGIGAATAIYSLADHVLLRPVPGVRAPDDLVLIRFQRDSEPGMATGISHPNLVDLRAAAPAFDGLIGYTFTSLQALPLDGEPLLLQGETVAGDYFGVLGVSPQLGRFFAPEELEARSAEQVAVISDVAWRRLYGGAADVIGRSLRLNAHEFTIIGVAPAGFRGPQRLATTDVWLPAPAYEAVRHFPDGHFANRRGGSFQQLIGRLAPAATAPQAEAQLRSAMAALVELYPEDNRNYEVYVPTVFEGIGTMPIMRDSLRRTMTLLGGVAALVLLIACANVANLILFRAVRRHGELAVRRALGADGRRLLRQSLVEGLVLTGTGSMGGAALAWLLVRLMRATEVRALPALEGLTLDVRVLGFATGLAVLTGLLFGLIGAFAVRGTELLPHIRRVSGATSRGIARGAFTVAQVAASVVLLAGALLMLRSVESLRSVDVGMDTDGVTVFGFMLEPQGYDAARTSRFLEDVTARLQLDPRISAAATASGVPVIAAYMSSGYRLPDDAPDRDVPLQLISISDDYFTALGMRVLAGRALTRHEAFGAEPDSEYPVVISETAARTLLAGAADPIGSSLGRTLVTTRMGPKGNMRVVGVATDVRTSLREPPQGAVFAPASANAMPFGAQFVVVRSPLPTRDVHEIVRAAVVAIEPAVPFWMADDLRTRIDATLAGERLIASLVTGFALLAVLLAAIGLYGVIAYAVAQRRREIGIRAALGALPLQLAGFVSRQALLATAIGAVIGIAGAVAGSRLLESWLFGVDRLDPAFYLAAAGGFGLVALLAAALPAHAAAATDPLESLRVE
jgi:putative ABC transport system permease protein